MTAQSSAGWALAGSLSLSYVGSDARLKCEYCDRPATMWAWGRKSSVREFEGHFCERHADQQAQQHRHGVYRDGEGVWRARPDTGER